MKKSELWAVAAALVFFVLFVGALFIATIKPQAQIPAPKPITPKPQVAETSAPQTVKASEPAPPPKPIDRASTVSQKFGDPHQCGPSDYYQNFGPQVPHPAGYGGLTNPKFLFASEKENLDNYTHGFAGIVPICFVVNDQGITTDIRLLQSPNDEIRDHLTTVISSWKFKPGIFKPTFRDPGNPVPVMIEIDVTYK